MVVSQPDFWFRRSTKSFNRKSFWDRKTLDPASHNNWPSRGRTQSIGTQTREGQLLCDAGSSAFRSQKDLRLNDLVERRNRKWGWLTTIRPDWNAAQPSNAIAMRRELLIRLSLEPRGSGPFRRGTTTLVAVMAIGRALGTDNFLGLE